MEKWRPEDQQEEPFAKLNLPDGKEVIATRENSQLYRHLGQLALFDFIRIEQEESNILIFNFVDGYIDLATYMVEQDYPIHLNMTMVEDSVEEAFYRAHGSIDDTVPDEWNMI